MRLDLYFQYNQQIKKLNNWKEFIKNWLSECIAYYNFQETKFADSFLFTNLFIFIQNKQLIIISYKKLINRYQPIILTKRLIKEKYNKC